jgi:hypothetical protein
MEDVEDFIESLPKDEQQLAKRLRSIILETEPRIQEKLSYGVPYFFRNQRICFLWPSSAFNGPKDAKIIFGLCRGNLLSNDQGILLAESRQQVYTAKFSGLSEINEQTIREIILEAVMVDDQFNKSKNKQKR